ncbi:MAG: restriction endonuclease subunit S [Acidobacteriota bacterium]|nr:restriction endonuclease subunit S [Acidobacteriota bacterium]
MVNKSWRVMKVSELIEGGVLAINDGYRVTNKELGDVGVPFIRGGDIGDGWIDTNVADHILPEFHYRIGAKLSQPEDVAFITKGTVGRVGYLRPGQPTVVFAPQVCYWRVLNREVLDPRFIYYMLRGGEFQSNLDAVKTHGSMVADYVSLSDQRQFQLTIPPIEEQKAIAKLLGLLDDKIELNRSMSETLEATGRCLFKSWFVDFDLVRAKVENRRLVDINQEIIKGFPSSFEESPLGLIPKTWLIKPLDEVAHFLNGLALQKFPPTGRDDLPVIKIAELRKGVTQTSGRANSAIDSKYIVNDGDILFSWSGSLDVVIWCGGRGALNQHLFKVTSVDYPKWFYFHWIKQHLPVFQAIAADKATTMGHIQRHHLHSALVVVPPGNLLASMDKVMMPLIERIVKGNLESRTVAELRDYLLPKLLSDKIKVSDAKCEVEQVV